MASITIKEALKRAMVAAKEYIDRRIPSEEDILDIMMEADVVQPMADENGAVFTDADGKIFIL